MFDIGFWEITVIAVVALLVVGPDEFPALVRNMGIWIGKIRSFMTETRNDLEREFNKAEELKKLIEKETHLAVLHEKIDARKMVAAGISRKMDIAAANKAQPDTTTPSATPEKKVISPNGSTE